MFALLLALAAPSGTVSCKGGIGVCDPSHCLGGIAECCADGSVCPGHTCAKCECADCGKGGHDKDYNAASLLTTCEGSPGAAPAFCQPNLCIGGTAMCCPSGKVCPGSTCAKCDCGDCTMTNADGSTSSIAHSGDAAYDDSSRLSTCTNSAAMCDPDKCIDDIAECCSDGTVCPGHTCAKCQCGDCTPHNRTHPLKPKPAPAGSAAGADTGPCSGCIYCDKLECAQCGACNAKLIAARFAKKATTTTAAPLPLLKAEAATQPAPRGAPTLLFLAGCAVGAALLGAAYVARSVSARIGAAKSADQYSAHVETGADGEGGVKRSLIGGGE